mgnify:CR=1 FL=1
MSLSRRDFLKSSAAASAAAAIGMSVPADLQAQADAAEGGWRWDKAACRFCGTGCGIMLATKEGKIVAVKGDPAAPVNRGLNCIKGYFNAKIMYGAPAPGRPEPRTGGLMMGRHHQDRARQGQPAGQRTPGLRCRRAADQHIRATVRNKQGRQTHQILLCRHRPFSLPGQEPSTIPASGAGTRTTSQHGCRQTGRAAMLQHPRWQKAPDGLRAFRRTG